MTSMGIERINIVWNHIKGNLNIKYTLTKLFHYILKDVFHKFKY